MEMYRNAFGLMIESITRNDFLILLSAILCAVFGLLTLLETSSIKKKVSTWKKESNKPFSKHMYGRARVWYTLFVTFISIFPLLGMLGTVAGLLGLDLTNGDMENIKNNFFLALTSTAWGIIFSVLFKIGHALVADGIEEQLEVAKKLSEESIDN